MKLDYKLSRIIVLGIAAVLILLGVAEGAFDYKVDRNIGSALLMIAAIVFFMGRKITDRSSETQNITEETGHQNENIDKNE